MSDTDDTTTIGVEDTTEEATAEKSKGERVGTLTQAIIFALLTANEQPYPLSIPAATKVADLLDDCGWRQTGEQVSTIELPAWMTERAREESREVPAEPDHHAMQDTDRVATAPEPPKRILKRHLGVVAKEK